jgi:hypothetical protein
MHALKYGAAADAYVARLGVNGARGRMFRDDVYLGSTTATWDRLANLAATNGARLCVILSGGSSSPGPATIRGYTADLVAHMDANHPGVLASVEPMNEPNIGVFAGNPAGYAALCSAVYDGVHTDAKSAVKVWGGATAGCGLTWTPQVLAAGAKFDEWSCHPYPAYGYYPDAAGMLRLDISSGWAELPKLAALLQGKGYPGKIHATEFGLPTNPPGGTAPRCSPETVQADAVRLGYQQWRAWPWAGWLLFYTGQDDNTGDTTDPEKHFGAYHTDGTEKPVVAAMKATA